MSDLRQPHLKNIYFGLSVAEFPPAIKYYTTAWCCVKGIMQLQNTTAITVQSVVHHPTQLLGLIGTCSVKKPRRGVHQGCLSDGHFPPYVKVFFRQFLLTAPSAIALCGAGTHGGMSKVVGTVDLNYLSFP